ncbi:MAG: hydroxyacid dehydrogenase [Eubacterium sp.]|nr:hydroxyacid dehydrogenase [Eubacterium sp.]
MDNLLITGAFKATDDQLTELKALGYNLIFEPDEYSKINCNPKEIDAVICNNLFLNTPIELFENLKYIQLTSAGFDRVPLDYIQRNKIEIRNAAGVYSIPMAEFAVCSILQLYKNGFYFYKNKENKIWNKCRDLQELIDKKVCIIGAGNIGTEVAKRLKPFVSSIIGIDLCRNEKEYFDSVLPSDRLDDQLNDSDIVILTLPLTKENKAFFNKDKFELMKKTSIFVNISRGMLVNENDLIDALRERKIFGAVLDVFEKEPLSEDSELWDFDNVIITPHNSFVGENNPKRLFKVILENLRNRK